MFFSVKETITILGKAYRPCICYQLPTYLTKTVESLEAEGKVTIYKERVYFCNGKLIEQKKSIIKAKKEKKVEIKEEHTQDKDLPDEIDESIIEGF